MDEKYSILIDSRSRFETGEPGGVWLAMPTTTEQLHEAMKSVGITADNPQDFFINGFANTEDCPFDVPLDVIQSGSMDELNYLGKLLEMQSDDDSAKFAAAVTFGERAGNLKDLINLAQNLDCYWLYPTVQSEEDYGYYIIDELDELELPAEAKPYFKYEEYGRDAAINDGGRFTEQGYVYNNKNTFTEWYNGREDDIPKEYRVMSYPQPERSEDKNIFKDAIGTEQAAPIAEQPRPVVPIILSSEKPGEKVKEITARLEQGIQAIFDSDRYKEFLNAMSKFHDYSVNNTILIAMQGGNLVKGYTQWQKEFGRQVKAKEKGIKIFAPAPYKVKQQLDKIDPDTKKPMLDSDGKRIKEEKEFTVPSFKVVTVFDVSQTEGKEFPDISVKPLLADVEQYEDFFAALEKTSPVPIAFEQIDSGANGYYHLQDKRIAIKEGVSELQAVKTAIHEIAHAKLHDVDLNAPKEEQARASSRTREVEAESVAYTVCQHFGLDTSDYSFGYVAGWSSGKELPELKTSLETIQKTAKELITEIEGHFTELQKQREAQAPVFDKLSPEQQQALSDTVKDTLQTLIDADKRIYGDVTGKTLEAIAAQGYSYRDGQLEKPARQEEKALTPDAHLTEDKIKTPRGSFSLADMTVEQMKEAGYSFHHQSDDGKYAIMTSNNYAYAVAVDPPEKVNPLKHVEDIVEQNDNNFDGIINNTPQTPTVSDLEQRAKAGEAISVTDLAKAVKAERSEQPPKKRSILKQLDEYKKQAAQQPQKQRQKDLKKDLEV
jgi:antirestriction protein ArdC